MDIDTNNVDVQSSFTSICKKNILEIGATWRRIEMHRGSHAYRVASVQDGCRKKLIIFRVETLVRIELIDIVSSTEAMLRMWKLQEHVNASAMLTIAFTLQSAW